MEIEKDDSLPDILATCKKCNKNVARNPAGFFKNGRDRRYVDKKGGIWNGKCCPKCHREKVKTHMKTKRNKDLQ